MPNLVALTSRELKALWYSPIAYVVGALFLMLQGWVFWILVAASNDPRVDPSWTMAQFFFGGTFFFWFSILIAIPLLTMRTFSEEKRTGTFEVLLTAPVTDAQVVLSKFLGAWIAYIMLWIPTLPFFLWLGFKTPLDWGPIGTGYLGTWLLGSVLTAVGVLASSLTRNQVIAAVLSFVIMLLLFSIGILDMFVRDPESSKMIHYLSLIDHLRDLSRGILDTRPIVYYLSLTAICLFLPWPMSQNLNS
ncbi:MAG: ABC transporter permease subunit [Candidatus Omnitrophica bacterium]|nr:ABC transporter permease subunit [Candidatus Omnitrophota bacterium]